MSKGIADAFTFICSEEGGIEKLGTCHGAIDT